MILNALYDYYNRSDKVAPVGKEMKEIAFLIVIKNNGTFVRIEDTRNEEGNGNKYLVSKSWGRTGTNPQPFHFWDNFSYVFGISSANVGIEKNDIDDNEKHRLPFVVRHSSFLKIAASFLLVVVGGAILWYSQYTKVTSPEISRNSCRMVSSIRTNLRQYSRNSSPSAVSRNFGFLMNRLQPSSFSSAAIWLLSVCWVICSFSAALEIPC